MLCERRFEYDVLCSRLLDEDKDRFNDNRYRPTFLR